MAQLCAGDRYFVCWDPDMVPPTVVQVSSTQISQVKRSVSNAAVVLQLSTGHGAYEERYHT